MVVKVGEAAAVAGVEGCVASMCKSNVARVRGIGAHFEPRAVGTLILEWVVELELTVVAQHLCGATLLVGKGTAIQANDWVGCAGCGFLVPKFSEYILQRPRNNSSSTKRDQLTGVPAWNTWALPLLSV